MASFGSVQNQFLIPGLSTPRLYLRLLEPGDRERVLPFFEHPLSHQYWITEGKPPATLCKEWFDKQQWRYAENRGGALAVVRKLDDALLGWCGLLVQEVDRKTELEVGYSILPVYWGNGYAPEAAKRCLQAGFEKELAPSIISIIQVHNFPSIRVAEKNGLVREKETLYHGNPVYVYRIFPPDFRP